METFQLELNKVVKYLFGFDIQTDIWDTDLGRIKGNIAERNSFFKYVHDFKKKYPEYNGIPDIEFIMAANLHDDSTVAEEYAKKIVKELILKITYIFASVQQFSPIIINRNNKLVTINGSMNVKAIKLANNNINFEGKNSIDKMAAILMRLFNMTATDEEGKIYESLDEFYDALFAVESAAQRKPKEEVTKIECINRYLYKLKLLKTTKEFHEICKINTSKEELRDNKWNYEFTKENIDYVLSTDEQPEVARKIIKKTKTKNKINNVIELNKYRK